MSPRLALVVLAVAAATARAEVKPPDPAAALARQRACLEAVVKQVSKVTFDRKDVERLLAEWRSFDALDEGLDREVEGVECFRIDQVLADPKYLAWARGRGLDPKKWLLASARISMTHAKRSAGPRAAEARAQFEAQRRELRGRCGAMGPTACAELERGFAAGEAALREGEKIMALFPEPTRAEAALLAEFAPRLEEVMESDGTAREAGPGDGAADEPEEQSNDDDDKPKDDGKR